MRTTLTIAFGILLLCGVIWLMVDRPVKDNAGVLVSSPELPLQEAPTTAKPVGPVPSEPAPQTTAGSTSIAARDPDAWETLEYGTFVNVREHRRKCQDTLHFLGAGEGDEVTTCERKFEFEHPYALFTDAQLAQIASTDGEAAFILAHRQLFPAEPGSVQDIESGVNNVLSAMIRGAGGQALDLLLDESVFSPHTDLGSFLLWSMIGEQLDIASAEQIDRLLKFREVTTIPDIEAIEQNAAEIANLLREQRLIVLGTEF